MTQRVLHIYQWKRSFLHFSIFLSFHSKWLRKLEMKCRLKGLRWKDQLFQQRYVDFLVYLLNDTTVLDKKCSEVCTFLLTGDPPCKFGATLIPRPTPPWSKMFSQEQKCSGCTSNIVRWARRGKYVEWTVLYRDVFWNWTYNVAHFSKNFCPRL